MHKLHLMWNCEIWDVMLMRMVNGTFENIHMMVDELEFPFEDDFQLSMRSL